MPDIHPTANVSPDAELADDVVIGPNCTIEAQVTLGPGTRLIGSAYLKGPLTMGANNTVYPFACIGYAPQHRKYHPKQPGAGIVVGDDNTFRESVTVHRAFTQSPTVIGSRNYFMVNAHVGHDCVIGSDCTLVNQVLLAGHVSIGDGVTMGGNAGAHQHVRIGRLAMVGGIVALRQDLPPFCITGTGIGVAGLNLVGLRRAGYRDHVRPLQRAFEILFQGGHTNPTAVALILAELGDDPLCAEFAHFVAGTKRGITRYVGARGDEAEA